MNERDRRYCDIAWRDGGRDFSGADCAGLAWLWLKAEAGIEASAPRSDRSNRAEAFLQGGFREAELLRGDVVFFRHARFDHVCHVAVYLGENQYLCSMQPCGSQIYQGLKLLRRVGFEPCGQLGPAEADKLCAALQDPNLRDATFWVMLAVSIALSAISAALAPSLDKNAKGRYGSDSLVTQKNPSVPLPDLLGSVVVAGNSVYQQLPDKNAATAEPQMWNHLVVLTSGPVSLIDYFTGLQVKGVGWQDKSFHVGTDIEGVSINPAQTKNEAVSGTIGADTAVPSVTLYDGAHGISVPVDVRAQYDRDHPVYGLSGCAYLAFRLVGATAFANFNVTCRTKGRLCRTFDASGFVVTTATGESLAGADATKVRFKLTGADIKAVSALTVNATSYTEMSASNQSGNVFSLNKLKGYVEFLTAPAAAATILITYTYYARVWTQNPASQIVYLLTERDRGKGFDESKVDWTSAVALRDYCDGSITWIGSNATVTGARFTTNYVLDDRKPVQDHITAILDGCHAMLFLSNGKFYLKARRDEASVFSFNTSNILTLDGQSTFEAELSDRTSKPNRVKLFYHSEDTLNAETEVMVDDESNQAARATRAGNAGVIEQNFKFSAVTSSGQAERLANISIQEQTGSNWIYRWKTTIKGLPIQPGDVVDITHPRLTTLAAKLARVETLEHDDQDRLLITATEYVAAAF